nr:hypothetical protein Hi04_10k_c5981_00035 [uncultured bacterium]
MSLPRGSSDHNRIGNSLTSVFRLPNRYLVFAIIELRH